MQLVSVRIIVNNIGKMVQFYEYVTQMSAVWHTPDFAEIHTPAATLAIGSINTLRLFDAGSLLQAGQHTTAIIEFMTADVDNLFNRLFDRLASSIIQKPTTMPWGNRSLLLRDPEGNLLNFFTPAQTRSLKMVAEQNSPEQCGASEQ